MPAATDQRTPIAAALANFGAYSLPEAARRFFATLGYSSDRCLPIATTKHFRVVAAI